MHIKIRIYLFLLFISAIQTGESQAISITNDSECLVAIFSVNESAYFYECTLTPDETNVLDQVPNSKLIAVDPYSLVAPRFKTELLIEEDSNTHEITIPQAYCVSQNLCTQVCPVSYTVEYLNELSGQPSTDVYQAFHRIDSKQIIAPNKIVAYNAEHQINLIFPFEVSDDSHFSIDILKCDNLNLDKDMTEELVYLGNIPLDLGFQYKERNIWDLQVYNDRIFMGYGNTTTNPGPIPLMAWDIDLDSFINYGIIRGEAIEKLRIIKDSLFIPNSDPKGDTRKYNVLYNGQLNEVILDYNMAHVRDIIPFNDRFYLLGNTRCPNTFSMDCSGILELDNSTYQTDLLISELSEADPYINARWNWFFGGWTYQNKLIIPNAMFNEIYAQNLTIKDAQFFTITDSEITWSANVDESERLIHQHFFPADTMTTSLDDTIKFHTILRPHTSMEIADKLVYTLRSYSINQGYGNLYLKEYNNSRGIYLKESLYDHATEILFPEPNAVGEDILSIEGKLYVLANKKLSNGMYKVFVYNTEAPTNNPSCWQELFHFKSSNLARSFEYDDDNFYFGLGLNDGDDTGAAGELYKLNWVIPPID